MAQMILQTAERAIYAEWIERDGAGWYELRDANGLYISYAGTLHGARAIAREWVEAREEANR